MKRILHVASGREWRGGQRQTWLLARELQRLGLDQLLLTRRGSELAQRARADGVPVREVTWSMGLDPRAYWALRREAQCGPAILHAHDGHAVTLARWASNATAPWIATRRNASPLGSPRAWRTAARVVAISDAVRAQLLRDGIAASRIVVVPSGVDLEAIRATRAEDLRAWARVPNGGALLVTVAALTPEKGLLTLIAAFALVLKERDIRWVVIGDGPMREQLRTVANDPSFHGKLVFAGHHPEPTRLLRDADLFVLTSRSEGLGTSVLDAMALDLPVVATDAGGLAELLAGGGGLLAPVDDPRAVATAIRRFLDEPELRRRCIEAGRATVARYTVQAMAAGMRGVYDSTDAT